jgi:hypothetical protein
MKLLRLVLLAVSTAPAWAGLNSAVIVLPAESARSAPSISIVQPADYLCAVLTLRSTAKDADRQSAAMRESLLRLTDAVTKSPRFQLHQGALRLTGSSNSFYSSATSAGPKSLQSTLRVLLPLQGVTDIFEAVRQLRRFVDTLPPTNDTELSVATIALAVSAPEQYRDRLLALIADQSRAIQQHFGARTVIIDGLQNAVAVRQVDDTNVELFVDYQLSANLDVR